MTHRCKIKHMCLNCITFHSKTEKCGAKWIDMANKGSLPFIVSVDTPHSFYRLWPKFAPSFDFFPPDCYIAYIHCTWVCPSFRETSGGKLNQTNAFEVNYFNNNRISLFGMKAGTPNNCHKGFTFACSLFGRFAPKSLCHRSTPEHAVNQKDSTAAHILQMFCSIL